MVAIPRAVQVHARHAALGRERLAKICDIGQERGEIRRDQKPLGWR